MARRLFDLSLLTRSNLGLAGAGVTPDGTPDARARMRARLRTQILVAIAASYAVDALLLAGFAYAGTVSYWVPALFLAAGWGSCIVFQFYFSSRWRAEQVAGSRSDPYVAASQFTAAAAIQIVGLACVPQLAFFFLTMLFIVFGIASLRLRALYALAGWAVVVLATGAALLRGADVSWLPQATALERVLVWLCFAVSLLRSLLLGTFGRSVRDALRRVNGDMQRTLQVLRQRDEELEHHRATLEAQVAERTEEMRLAKEAAENASRVKSQFLAVMSHELRTPMNAVLGMSELLQRTGLSEQQRTLLGHVNTAGRSLLGIIEDVLDLSRIEEGRTRIAIAPFDLRAEMREVVALFEQTAADRGLSLGLSLDPRLAQYVYGDAGRIRQILINLVGNALKFTDHGGVTVHVMPTEDGVRWTVSDSGTGIDPAFLPHIYEAFSQQDASATRRFGGTGLGLAIVKRLVDAMQGTIAITSRLGEGSTFTVDLPLARAHGPQDAAAAPAPPAAVPAAGARAAARILIVEDNATNREYMRLLLEAHGMRLELAADGLEALQMLSERRFDLVLMDRQMPQLDGVGATLRIRGMEAVEGTPRTPIIAVSAHVMDKSRRDFIDAGADDFLPKPFTPDELLEVIGRWLPGAVRTGMD